MHFAFSLTSDQSLLVCFSGKRAYAWTQIGKAKVMKNPQAIALGAAILAVSMGGLATSQSMPASTAATPDPKASPLLPDDIFVRAVQRSNDNEIAASRYVLKTTKSAPVRGFATMMVQDHSTAEVSLQTTSRNAHVALSQSERAMTMEPASLKTATGASLDREYFVQQVAAHKDALKVLTAYASKGANPILKAYASDQVSIVQSHLDTAENALAMMPAKLPTASASVAPIPPGGNESAGSKNGGQIVPNPSASPVTSASASAAASSSPNPQPSLPVPNTPGPLVSASPRP